MEPPPARNLQSCIKNHGFKPLGENPRNEGGSSWAHHEGGLRSEGCPWVAVDAFLLPLPSFLQSLLQFVPSLASRVLACSWVSRERSLLQMTGWVREVLLQLRLIQFVLTGGSYSLKWQTTHFSLSVAILCFTGWSGRASELSGISLSLLNWFNHGVVWY
jgi:hypothetical protein